MKAKALTNDFEYLTVAALVLICTHRIVFGLERIISKIASNWVACMGDFGQHADLFLSVGVCTYKKTVGFVPAHHLEGFVRP